ncbi:hypothetical protein M758_UG137500 [Ceratodon purpureus]|nr:hypothetical protein M758_UG137500 [Ceratodon purpureus]
MIHAGCWSVVLESTAQARVLFGVVRRCSVDMFWMITARCTVVNHVQRGSHGRSDWARAIIFRVLSLPLPLPHLRHLN